MSRHWSVHDLSSWWLEWRLSNLDIDCPGPQRHHWFASQPFWLQLKNECSLCFSFSAFHVLNSAGLLFVIAHPNETAPLVASSSSKSGVPTSAWKSPSGQDSKQCLIVQYLILFWKYLTYRKYTQICRFLHLQNCSWKHCDHGRGTAHIGHSQDWNSIVRQPLFHVRLGKILLDMTCFGHNLKKVCINFVAPKIYDIHDWL